MTKTETLVAENEDIEKLFSITLEFIENAVIATDNGGRITYMNTVAEKITGWRKLEALNKNIETIFTVNEDRNEGAKNPAIRAIEERKVVEKTTGFLQNQKGEQIPINATASPIIDKGTCLGSILSFKDLTERRRSEEEIEYRLKFEKTIAEISSGFIDISNLYNATNYALRRLGMLCGAHGACLFLFQEGGIIKKINEWHANYSRSRIKPKDLKSQDLTQLVEWVKKGEPFYIEDIEDMERQSEKAQEEKKMLERLQVRSLIILPIYIEGKTEGFVIFDNVRKKRWTEDLNLLKVFSHILGNALERRKSQIEFQTRVDKLQKSMRDTIFATSKIYEKISSRPSRRGKNPGF